MPAQFGGAKVASVRILFLSTDFAWPADSGGRVRTLSQLRVLASLAAVEHIRFFSMREGEIPAEQREALMRQVPKLDVAEPVFHPIHLFRHRRYVPHVAWLRVARGVPYLAGKWDSSVVRAAVRSELESRDYDTVWLNGLGIARYLPLVRRLQPSARVVLDQHNVESDRFAQFAQRQRGVKRLVAQAESRAARRWERDVLRAVDAVGAISGDDVRAYRELAGVEAVSVPQLVPIAERKAETEAAHFCWVGNLSWGPNARGLDWFCTEVWPRVRPRLPDATLEIVGSGLATDAGGNAVVPAAWQVPGVTTLGFVEDLAPVYARSIAMVAPILGGAGIRIKLLEAFRHGVPAVTTPDGAAGLPIEPGRECFVESEAAAFAERAVQLATGGALRERLRDAGYAFLARHNQVAEAQAAVSKLLGSDGQAARGRTRASIAVS